MRDVVLIIGSREYPQLDDVVDYVNTLPRNTVVVSGGARGVDITAEQAAIIRKLTTKIFPVEPWEWERTRAAGHIRNEVMANFTKRHGGRCVAFAIQLGNDRTSRGTQGMIDFCKKVGLPVDVRFSR